MSDEIIELIGTDSPNGHIRIRIDLELPHDQAMQILQTVHDYKDQKQKEEAARMRRDEAERRKAEAEARKAAKTEAAKAKKSGTAKGSSDTTAQAD
ncbi:MAG TPA: hypothetical protein DCL95_13490 [Rhodospirillaceae bacterium]|nr:hypothetical protein [Rhodospirillaceae bacterium]MAX62949.1 hypothetical protein [Rhodospirillaceae bacterium]MBB57796.1 hypothetical protein [Rhodospirillaceae bacterium]HAE00298.1 hypothetical protein [Rhodospirillaceae bacterium]HAJ21049.1 hypothetical protein [Rhodospirillaceae bacterium]|tara:strand:- start:107 stop:394 length:288 start_codon:yes stop_codon:yes gene_type:complete